MIIRFFMDIPPGSGVVGFPYHASTNPPPKAAGIKRIAFDVDLPDEVLIDADYYYPVEVTKPKKEKKGVKEKPSDTPILEVPDSF